MGSALSVIGVPNGAGPYSAALEGLTALDEYYLRANPTTPALRDAGVVYSKQSTDKWRDVGSVLKTHTGDCEALASWRSAELRVSGEDPNASVVVYKTGPSKYHAIVLRGDGSVEDPSVELGMKPPTGLLDAYNGWNDAVAAAPQQEDRPMVMGANDDVACAVIGANDDPSDVEIVFDILETEDGYKGVLRIPLIDGRAIFGATSTASSPAEAEGKARRVLGVIGSVWDDLAALVPGVPQAQAAIRLAKNEHVQNLAKGAYQAGKRALGSGTTPRGGGYDPITAFATRPLPTDATTTDDGSTPAVDDNNGQGYTDAPGFASDVMGYDSASELEILGFVNQALARGSKPKHRRGKSVIGAGLSAMSTSKSGSTSRAASAPRAGVTFSSLRSAPTTGPAPGYSVAPTPAQALAAYGPAGMSYAQLTAAAANPAAVNPGFVPAYGTPYGGTYPGYTPSAQAAYAQQLQRTLQADQMLAQSGGSGGGGGGGGGDAFGGDYTAADAATDQQMDADLFNAYYGYQAAQDAESAWWNTAQEATPESFYGTVNPYQAEAMLADDSIPAQ